MIRGKLFNDLPNLQLGSSISAAYRRFSTYPATQASSRNLGDDEPESLGITKEFSGNEHECLETVINASPPGDVQSLRHDAALHPFNTDSVDTAAETSLMFTAPPHPTTDGIQPPPGKPQFLSAGGLGALPHTESSSHTAAHMSA